MEAAALAVATLAGDTLDPVAWEEVLKHNPSNHLALSKLADIARMQGRHLEAAGHLERLLAVGMPPSDCAGASSEPAGLGEPRSQGEVHAALGHCFLAVSHQESELSGILRRMQESHDAYKLALAQMMQGEDPDLWYGIGLLYDRYASLMKPCAQKSECEAAASKAFDAVLITEQLGDARPVLSAKLGWRLPRDFEVPWRNRGSPESDGEYPAAALAALEARNAVDRAVYERAVRAFEAVLRRRARRRGGRGGVL